MRRAEARIRRRIRNMVDELHHKHAHWLCSNYDTIILPEFRVLGMVQKGKRRIGKQTVSRMYSLAHYRFRQFVAHKAKQHGASLFLSSEAHTTVTCGHCGAMYKVGTSETYDCPACHGRFDRDTNAARNILLKFVHDNS